MSLLYLLPFRLWPGFTRRAKTQSVLRPNKIGTKDEYERLLEMLKSKRRSTQLRQFTVSLLPRVFRQASR